MAPTQDKLQTPLVEKLKNIGFAPTKKVSLQGIEEILAKAFKLGFYCANTGIKGAFFRFLEIVLWEMVHQGTLDSKLAKSFDLLLQSDTLVCALVKKTSTQSPHSQVILDKGMSSGRLENVASMEEHHVAFSSSSDIESLFNMSNADSAIYTKPKSRTARKTAKRGSYQKKDECQGVTINLFQSPRPRIRKPTISS